MSAPSLSARDIVRDIVRQDARKCGGAVNAQRLLARTLGVAPGTIRNLLAGRLKRVCADMFIRLKAEELRRLNNQIQKAAHDLEVARAIGVDPNSADFLALAAAVEAAESIRRHA